MLQTSKDRYRVKIVNKYAAMAKIVEKLQIMLIIVYFKPWVPYLNMASWAHTACAPSGEIRHLNLNLCLLRGGGAETCYSWL